MSGGRKRFCLLFSFVYLDYPIEGTFLGCPTRHRIRNNRFNGKYHARDYGSSRCASFCQIFRPVVSYLCWRCHDYGYDLAYHHSLFGKRPCFHFNFSWDYRRFYSSVFCVVLLLVLDMVPFLLKYVTYFASNRQKKCRRFPFTGFLHPDVNGLDTRV